MGGDAVNFVFTPCLLCDTCTRPMKKWGGGFVNIRERHPLVYRGRQDHCYSFHPIKEMYYIAHAWLA